MPNKQTISEGLAAVQFCTSLVASTKDAWPVISKQLNDMFGSRLVFLNEKIAPYDLAIATIVLELDNLKNLVDESRLANIYAWTINMLDTPPWGDYSKKRLSKYQSDLKDDRMRNQDPSVVVAARLIQAWIGPGIKEFEVIIDDKSSGIIDPKLIVLVSGLITPFMGYWRKLLNTHSLTYEDLPADFDNNRKSPFGMSDSKVTGRIYKVFISGPWEESREEMWEIDDETAQKYVDDLNQAYVMCVYENEKPRYIYMKKNIWDEMNTMVEGILKDTSTSEEQKIEGIEKFIEKVKKSGL